MNILLSTSFINIVNIYTNKYSLNTTVKAKQSRSLADYTYILWLALFLSFIPAIAVAQCPDYPTNPTKVVEGGNNAYNINANETYIFKGTFTGQINSFDKTAKIYVDAAATFNPTNFNGATGEIINCGTINFSGISLSDGFNLINFNKVNFNSNINFNGKATLTNKKNAVISIYQSFSLSNNSEVTNEGTINQHAGNLDINNGTINNYGYILNTTGSSAIGGTLQNFGLFSVKEITLNNPGTLNNNCTVLAQVGVINNSVINNEGFILATGSNGSITNNGNGTIKNNGFIQGHDFNSDGIVHGVGNFYFTGTTKVQGNNFAKNVADDITFYDTTSKNNSIFDAGNSNGNVTRKEVSPLPATYRPQTCSEIVKPIIDRDEPTELPVEMVSFAGTSQNGKIMLNWATATEKNNEKFEVERSLDGLNFVKIASVAGKGNATTKNNYSYEDLRVPGKRVVYYRLKQIDFDGQQAYSKIIAIKNNAFVLNSLVYPNPFTNGDQVNVNIGLTESASVKLTLVNLAGKTVLHKQVAVATNGSISLENLDQLLPGIYVLRLECNGAFSQHKLIKK